MTRKHSANWARWKVALAPVVLVPFGGAESFLPSAGLLFPTTSWGTNYVAVMPMLWAPLPVSTTEGPQWAQIIAAGG